jgi:hypothetical protein
LIGQVVLFFAEIMFFYLLVGIIVSEQMFGYNEDKIGRGEQNGRFGFSFEK